MSEAEQRFAPRRFKAGHAGQRDFERYRDLPLDFFGRSAGKLRDHLDDGGRGVRIRFDVDPPKRYAPDHRQGYREQYDDEWISERPVDQFSNHSLDPRADGVVNSINQRALP